MNYYTPFSLSIPSVFPRVLSFAASAPLLTRTLSHFIPLASQTTPKPFLTSKRTRPRNPILLRPQMKVSEEDPVAQRVRQQLAADGINLDDLLNSAKVIDLSRKLENLTSESQRLSAQSHQREQLSKRISKIEADLVREKRLIMQTWLKQLFLVQAYAFIALGGVLSTNLVPEQFSVPLVGRALGFWLVWLFTIPALRARKGISKTEKSALNVSFLSMPLLNVALPTLTRNTGVIWAADVVLLAACYLYYGIKAVNQAEDGNAEAQKEEGRVKGVLKYLDWGSWR